MMRRASRWSPPWTRSSNDNRASTGEGPERKEKEAVMTIVDVDFLTARWMYVRTRLEQPSASISRND